MGNFGGNMTSKCRRVNDYGCKSNICWAHPAWRPSSVVTKQVVASCHNLLQAIACEAHLGQLRQVGNEHGRVNKVGYISLKLTGPISERGATKWREFSSKLVKQTPIDLILLFFLFHFLFTICLKTISKLSKYIYSNNNSSSLMNPTVVGYKSCVLITYQ